MKRASRQALIPLLAAVVSLLPHAGAVFPGLTYYFRDFTLTFYPQRVFEARELAAGRLPFWNPYIHQGAFFLPSFYPLDLLHVLWPGPSAVSWLLTLQFPLAALTAYALARELGAGRLGAFVAGTVYAMGGLAISSLNLYIFLQALALAPLLALTLRRAATRGGRSIPAAGAVLALALTTMVVEFVAQAVVLGVALGLAALPRREALARTALALALGLGLAALPLALTLGVLGETARAAGFSRAQALDFALPPLGLLQVLVPEAFGSVGAPIERWWGGLVFPRRFPYFATIYLGATALTLAWVGSASLDRRTRRVLLGLGLLGLWYALGRSGGLAPLVVGLPVLRWFRYPTKALLLPYAVLAVLAGVGADRLTRGQGWERLRGGAGAAAGALTALGVLVLAFSGSLARWLDVAPDTARLMAWILPVHCLGLALVALAALALGLAVRAGRLAPARAAILLAGVLVLDLDLAGSGVNRQAPVAFFQQLPELAAEHLEALGGGRVFSYGVEWSPRVLEYLAGHPRQGELAVFFAARQVLDPYAPVLDGIEAADGSDRTGLIPNPPALAPADYAPARVGETLTRLRNLAVTRVLSLDPLDHPDLRLRATVPLGPPGIEVHVYELLDPWPRTTLSCHVLQARSHEEALERPLSDDYDPERDVVLEQAGSASCREGSARLVSHVPGEDVYEVESDGSGYLFLRDSYARGWTARVDGRSAAVLRANGRFKSVPVPGGRHEVRLRYVPPGLTLGLGLMALACAGTALLWFRPVLRAGPV